MNTEIQGHSIVPKHELLSEEEAQRVLMQYKVDRSKIPKILITDPALPEGAKIGDLIKITRASETAGESTYYRVVIEQVS